jgi:CheY-like chemotaxis protein
LPDTTQRSVRVLVIDDSEIVLETVRSVLEDEGFVVSTRSMAYGSSWAIVELCPDVVLVDVNMPGLGGADIVNIARSRSDLAKTRVLLFSSEPPERLDELAFACQADGWIRKSSDPQALVASIRKWVRQPRRADAPAGAPSPSPALGSPPERPVATSNAAAAPIMFVDPDAKMLTFYREIFGGAFPTLDCVESGPAALARLRSRAVPKLVVSEIAMPGVSGADLYERVRQAHPETGFLFVTGADSREVWVARFINGLQTRVLHKPVSATDLHREVLERLSDRNSP